MKSSHSRLHFQSARCKEIKEIRKEVEEGMAKDQISSGDNDELRSIETTPDDGRNVLGTYEYTKNITDN